MAADLVYCGFSTPKCEINKITLISLFLHFLTHFTQSPENTTFFKEKKLIIIIIKCFFFFYNLFSILNQLCFSSSDIFLYLSQLYCCFFLFLLQKYFDIFYKLFFVSFFVVLIIFTWWILGNFYICEKQFYKNINEKV